MPPIDRRQTLWIAAGTAAAGLFGGTAVAQAMRRPPRRDGSELAVIEKDAGRLVFHALPDGRCLASITLGTQPHEIAADPEGHFAYVGGYGVPNWKAPGEGGHLVWVIDLAGRRLDRTIDLSPLGRLHAVRIDARGRLYVLAEKDCILARFDNPATDTAPSRLVPVGGARSHYLVIRRDGSKAYAADTLSGAVILVDPEDMGISPVRRRIGTAPEALTLSRDERTLFAIDRPTGTLHALDAMTLTPRAERKMRGEAVRLVTQADGRLIVSNKADKSLSRLNPVSLAEEGRLQLPAAASGLTLAADTLYASLENDRVAIIDLARWTVTGGFATGAAPDAAILIG